MIIGPNFWRCELLHPTHRDRSVMPGQVIRAARMGGCPVRGTPVGRHASDISLLTGAGVVVEQVDCRLLGGRPAAVNPRVMSDKIGIVVEVFPRVSRYQPARPGIGTIVNRETVHILLCRVLVPAKVRTVGIKTGPDVRFFLGEQLIEGLASLLLSSSSAEFHRGRPSLRGSYGSVQRVIPWRAI